MGVPALFAKRLLLVVCVGVHDNEKNKAPAERLLNMSDMLYRTCLGFLLVAWALSMLACTSRSSHRDNDPDGSTDSESETATDTSSETADTDTDVEIDWVFLDGGTFMMGSESGEENEMPVHQVSVPAFQMMKTEVTLEQYFKCSVSVGGCEFDFEPTGGPYAEKCNWDHLEERMEHPINCVTWLMAEAFCEWIGARLPSEAEWEYASRNQGQDVEYPWCTEGEECPEPTCDYCVMNMGEDTPEPFVAWDGCGEDRTWPVCSKPLGNTHRGLCDMVGNVREMVQDDYHLTYEGAPSDGSAWLDVSQGSSVVRGGDKNQSAEFLRIRKRLQYFDKLDEDGRMGITGFRCAREPKPDDPR